jgi:hypothetical protein
MEAQLRMRQQALKVEEAKLKRKQSRCSSSRTVAPTTEVEFRDICSTSFSGWKLLTCLLNNICNFVQYFTISQCPLQRRHISLPSKELNAVHLNLHALPRLACSLLIPGIIGKIVLSL